MLQKTPQQAAATPDLAEILKRGGSPARFRRFAVIAVVALLALAGIWYWWAASSGSTAPVYSTAPVTRGDLTVTVNATGTIEPTNQVEISSELSGTVGTVLVDFNDTVAKGQVLARLNTDKLTANVNLARATLASRRASVLQAEATVTETAATYRRAARLQGKGVTSAQGLETAKADADRAEAALAAAKADLEIAEANLAISQTDLAKADIRSPIDGVVLDRAIEPGQIVASSLSAPVLFTLAEDLSEMELQVDIDEADMAKVKTGEDATFTVEAYRDRKFPARIAQIRFSPETVEGVVTYKAILTVDNADLLLRPGMTATAEITVEDVKDALLVPNAALRYAPAATETTRRGSGLLGLLLPRPPAERARSSVVASDGSRTIWVLRDGAPVGVPVTVGSSDGSRTAVTGDGLKEDDLVIVGAKTAS
jgi:HlyD family secretion protein